MKFHTRYVTEDDAELRWGRYHDDSIALVVQDQFGEQLCKATVCMSASNVIPEPGNVFIKDWSENEGVLQALQDAGIIGPSLHTVAAGYIEAHECKLLVDLATIKQL